MQASYEMIDKWVAYKSPQFKEVKIGLIISLVNNGVFPGLSVSKAMNLPLSFLTTEHGQIYFPHSKQVSSIVELTKKEQTILLCLDNVSRRNQGDILAVQKFLTDFNANYKTLTIHQDKDTNVKIDFYFKEIKEAPPENIMAQFEHRTFL